MLFKNGLKKLFVLLFIVMSFIIFCGVGFGAMPLQMRKLNIFVTLPPQQFLVEKIAGELVNVECLVKEGQNPHTFEVSPQIMKRLYHAELYFKIGEHFEEQLVDKISEGHTKIKVLDSSVGIQKRKIEENIHEHNQDQNHKGEFLDPHIWVSPILLQQMAKNIADGLIPLLPTEKGEMVKKNLALLLQQLSDLDHELQGILAPFRGQAIYTFHPDFGYFTDLYGLKQVSVEVSGKSPTPKSLMGMVSAFKSSGVKVIFVQPQFDHRSAKMIADAIGGRVVELNPMRKDIVSEIKKMGATFVASFQEGSQESKGLKGKK